MLDRASVVDAQFISRVTQANFPSLANYLSPAAAGIEKKPLSNYLMPKLNQDCSI